MVWYYCEFCNKNVQVSEGKITCKSCGHLLYSQNITKEERNRRDRERTTYCECCDKMEYAVPIQIVSSNIKQQGQMALHSIKNPAKPALTVKDGRYKSGYRYTAEGEKQVVKYCILCFMTMVTLGLALIPLGIYYFIKNMKSKDEIQAKFNITTGNFENVLKKLNEINVNYTYICRSCFNGVKIGKNIRPRQLMQTSIKIYCEMCGSENYTNQKFCVNCGSQLKI